MDYQFGHIITNVRSSFLHLFCSQKNVLLSFIFYLHLNCNVFWYNFNLSERTKVFCVKDEINSCVTDELLDYFAMCCILIKQVPNPQLHYFVLYLYNEFYTHRSFILTPSCEYHSIYYCVLACTRNKVS